MGLPVRNMLALSLTWIRVRGTACGLHREFAKTSYIVNQHVWRVNPSSGGEKQVLNLRDTKGEPAKSVEMIEPPSRQVSQEFELNALCSSYLCGSMFFAFLPGRAFCAFVIRFRIHFIDNHAP
jgi:hypothetical protein